MVSRAAAVVSLGHDALLSFAARRRYAQHLGCRWTICCSSEDR